MPYGAGDSARRAWRGSSVSTSLRANSFPDRDSTDFQGSGEPASESSADHCKLSLNGGFGQLVRGDASAGRSRLRRVSSLSQFSSARKSGIGQPAAEVLRGRKIVSSWARVSAA